MSRKSVEIVVIGAGVIGLAVACALAADGREVHVLDPEEPGSGASFGNAGTIAPYGCAPIGNPDVLRDLPQLLFGSNSPFALKWTELPTLAPWLLRFAVQCLNGNAQANAVALAHLLREAVPAWRELAEAADATHLMTESGCLYAQIEPGGGIWSETMRSKLAVNQQRLSPSEIAAMEPNLPPMPGGGIFFADALRIVDPSKLTQALTVKAKASAVLARARVDTIAPQRDGRVHVDGRAISLIARKVVIAAGAYSKPLARAAGDEVPLGVERGYHVEFATQGPLLGRPVCVIDHGFYLTPMDGRLRAAGTVELGGVTAPPTPSRLEFIERRARAIFPHLDRAQSRWLGFRPSLPDSKPIIGYSRTSRSVVHAFGHGHLGMTLAAVTARKVAELVGERPEAAMLAAFSAARFRKG